MSQPNDYINVLRGIIDIIKAQKFSVEQFKIIRTEINAALDTMQTNAQTAAELKGNIDAYKKAHPNANINPAPPLSMPDCFPDKNDEQKKDDIVFNSMP